MECPIYRTMYAKKFDRLVQQFEKERQILGNHELTGKLVNEEIIKIKETRSEISSCIEQAKNIIAEYNV